MFDFTTNNLNKCSKTFLRETQFLLLIVQNNVRCFNAENGTRRKPGCAKQDHAVQTCDG